VIPPADAAYFRLIGGQPIAQPETLREMFRPYWQARPSVRMNEIIIPNGGW